MVVMNKRYVPKLSVKETDRIWDNTKRWKTADSEVAVLYDFTSALLKCGYRPNSHESQGGGVRYDDSLVILEKSGVEQAFDNLCNTPARFDNNQYRDGKLGLHPSSILSSRDLMSNPELMVLLLGEIYPRDYLFKKGIKTDSENKEIIIENYRFVSEDRCEGDNCPFRKLAKYDLSRKEALDSAAKLAASVSALSSLEKRLEVSDVDNKYSFEFERNIGGKLELGFENPYLTVGGKPLYETGAINQNLMKKREAEKRLASLDNPKAKQQVETAIANYEANIESEKGAYFPMFKILK